jgi:hypothetical protein
MKMTPRHFSIAALMLLGTVVSAGAQGQTPVPDASNPGGSIRQQELNRNNTLAPGGQIVEIAPEQRTRIKEYVARERIPRVTMRERYRVGASVPADVELREVPADWGPSVSNYRYYYTDSGIHFVDPASRRVVYDID